MSLIFSWIFKDVKSWFLIPEAALAYMLYPFKTPLMPSPSLISIFSEALGVGRISDAQEV